MDKAVFAETIIFKVLFSKVCEKCFGELTERILSETESKLLSHKIEEATGLVIGWKSLKNYSFALWEKSSAKKANPTTATLDTLSRYVLNAPYSNETERKDSEDVYAYWFNFRETCIEEQKRLKQGKKIPVRLPVLISLFVLVVFFILWFVLRSANNQYVEEDFKSTDETSLNENGWNVFGKCQEYWQRRNENKDCLTLFTLRGDSWPNEYLSSEIKNVLYREVSGNNFSAEVHFSNFIPTENWQQAGIILLEDTLFTGKYIRISLAYNNKPGEPEKSDVVLTQVVASEGHGSLNVEEVVNYPLLSFNDNSIAQIEKQLRYSALKIEKRDGDFRFLRANDSFRNYSFKEIGTYKFDMDVKYVGIFAMKGFFVCNSSVIPVKVRYFSLKELGAE